MEHQEKNKTKDTVPFYPDHVTTEFKVAVGIIAIALLFGIIGLFKPVGLQPPADPMNTPEHVKPEWYFLALYQLLKFVPKDVGVAIPILAVILITIWPFLDRKPDRDKKAIRYRFIAVAIMIIVLIALTIWGEVS